MQPRLIGISFSDDSSGTQSFSASRHHTNLYYHQNQNIGRSWRPYRKHISPSTLSSLFPSLKQRNLLVKRNGTSRQLLVTSSRDSLRLADSHVDRSLQKAHFSWVDLPKSALNITLEYLARRDQRPLTRQAERIVRQDLMSMQRTCKAWYYEAANCLYQDIYIHDTEPHLKTGTTGRIMKHNVVVLLRRTLRNSQTLANYVTNLRFVLSPYNKHSRISGGQGQSLWHSDLIASLVMCCPKLEKLIGVQPVYRHTFDRLVHALSTRTRLKQYSWLIGEDSTVTARAQTQLSPGILNHGQTSNFLDFHIYWKNLEKLKLVSYKGNGILEHNVFAVVLRLLPSLKHLHVVGFDVDDFTDLTLLALPALTSLRLEHCLGVSDSGLCRWAQSSTVTLLQGLTLINQDLVSLLTISTLFSHLASLRTFHLAQDVEPSLPLEFPIIQPLLASESLTKLKWKISSMSLVTAASTHKANSDVSPKPVSNLHTVPLAPDQHLILSYMGGGLPRLRYLQFDNNQRLANLIQWASQFAPSLLSIQPTTHLNEHPQGSMFYLQQNILPLPTKQSSPSIFTHYDIPPTSNPSLSSTSKRQACSSISNISTKTNIKAQPPCADPYHVQDIPITTPISSPLSTSSTSSPSSLTTTNTNSLSSKSSNSSQQSSTSTPYSLHDQNQKQDQFPFLSFTTATSNTVATKMPSADIYTNTPTDSTIPTNRDENSDTEISPNPTSNIRFPTATQVSLRPMLRAEDRNMDFKFDFDLGYNNIVRGHRYKDKDTSPQDRRSEVEYGRRHGHDHDPEHEQEREWGQGWGQTQNQNQHQHQHQKRFSFDSGASKDGI